MAKTAFVTGNRGFVGRHITKKLVSLGYRVLGVDASAVDDAKSCFRRLTDRFDLVAHCAYVVGGRATIDGTNTALIENTLLDAMLFDWALRTKQKAVIYFSSSAAYPICYQQQGGCKYGFHWHPNKILEEDDIDLNNLEQPDAHYGWAKLNGERLARVAGENGLRVHVVRPFSGYGEDQSLDYPFPSIIRRATLGDLSVWGPEGQTRDWVHIDDIINATMAIYENDERRPVNICTGVRTEMGDLMVEAWEQATGKEFTFPEMKITYLEDKPTGVFYRVGDPSRMNEHYTAKISIEEGVRRALQRSGN